MTISEEKKIVNKKIDNRGQSAVFDRSKTDVRKCFESLVRLIRISSINVKYVPIKIFHCFDFIRAHRKVMSLIHVLKFRLINDNLSDYTLPVRDNE